MSTPPTGESTQQRRRNSAEPCRVDQDRRERNATGRARQRPRQSLGSACRWGRSHTSDAYPLKRSGRRIVVNVSYQLADAAFSAVGASLAKNRWRIRAQSSYSSTAVTVGGLFCPTLMHSFRIVSLRFVSPNPMPRYVMDRARLSGAIVAIHVAPARPGLLRSLVLPAVGVGCYAGVMCREGMGLEYTTLVVIPPRAASRPAIRSRSRIERASTLIMKQSAPVT